MLAAALINFIARLSKCLKLGIGHDNRHPSIAMYFKIYNYKVGVKLSI